MGICFLEGCLQHALVTIPLATHHELSGRYTKLRISRVICPLLNSLLGTRHFWLGDAGRDLCSTPINLSHPFLNPTLLCPPAAMSSTY